MCPCWRLTLTTSGPVHRAFWSLLDVVSGLNQPGHTVLPVRPRLYEYDSAGTALRIFL